MRNFATFIGGIGLGILGGYRLGESDSILIGGFLALLGIGIHWALSTKELKK